MKNLPNAQTGPKSRCVPSEKGGRITPCDKTFRRRPEIQFQTPKYREKIEWMIRDFDSFHAALLRKLSLGSLPKRAAKYGCADFDLGDERKYCGHDGESLDGGTLAGIAAYIVRCAKDPIDYLFSLKNVPAKVIEPMKVYLRVKLALGRVAAEISIAKTVHQESTASITPGQNFKKKFIDAGNSPEQSDVESELGLTSLSKRESRIDQINFRPCADEVLAQGRDDSVSVPNPCPNSNTTHHPQKRTVSNR